MASSTAGRANGRPSTDASLGADNAVLGKVEVIAT
jgi:hypothetical protein